MCRHIRRTHTTFIYADTYIEYILTYADTYDKTRATRATVPATDSENAETLCWGGGDEGFASTGEVDNRMEGGRVGGHTCDLNVRTAVAYVPEYEYLMRVQTIGEHQDSLSVLV